MEVLIKVTEVLATMMNLFQIQIFGKIYFASKIDYIVIMNSSFIMNSLQLKMDYNQFQEQTIEVLPCCSHIMHNRFFAIILIFFLVCTANIFVSICIQNFHSVLSHQKKLFRMLFKWLAIVPASYTLWWCFYSDVSFLMYKWPNILTGCMDYFFNQPWLTFIYVLLHLPLLSSKISYAIRYQFLLCQVRTFLPLQFLFRYIIKDGLLEF